MAWLDGNVLCGALLAVCVGMGSAAGAYDGQPLDRSKFTRTFNDDFNAFNWYAEGDVKQKGGGTWRTNFGYTWVGVNDVKNHTLIWNKEEQIYVDPGYTGSGTKALGLSAFSTKNGILTIKADRTANPKLNGYKYTSGLITSEPTFKQAYGLFEMRARLPKGRGLWPAFWLLPSDKSWPPEIDIMENLGHNVTHYYTTLHTNETGTHTTSNIPIHPVPDLSAGFHTYAVDWEPDEIVFYFDDKEIGRRPTPKDMNKPFYILINLAVGGGWPGSPDAQTQFPATYDIDWVRVWQRGSNSTNAASSTTTPKTAPAASQPSAPINTSTQPAATRLTPASPQPSGKEAYDQFNALVKKK